MKDLIYKITLSLVISGIIILLGVITGSVVKNVISFLVDRPDVAIIFSWIIVALSFFLLFLFDEG